VSTDHYACCTTITKPSKQRPRAWSRGKRGRRRPGLQANPALGHTRNEEAAFPFLLGRLLALLCLLVLLGLLLRAAVVVTAARQQEAEEQP